MKTDIKYLRLVLVILILLALVLIPRYVSGKDETPFLVCLSMTYQDNVMNNALTKARNSLRFRRRMCECAMFEQSHYNMTYSSLRTRIMTCIRHHKRNNIKNSRKSVYIHIPTS